MSELDDLLREHGPKLQGVTLFASSSTGGRWQGNARWNSNLGWTVEHSDDPVEALVKALKSNTRFDHTKNPVGASAPAAPEAGVFD